jgi:DNA-binding NarL/FixJ family response regulator
MYPMDPITVLIIDGHEELRRVLVRRLDGLTGLHVVGETGSPTRGVELAASTRPDVILFDAPAPRLYGAELCARIVRSSPGSRVVVFTSVLDQETEGAYRRAGAERCLVKGLAAGDLAEELAAIAGGQPTGRRSA